MKESYLLPRCTARGGDKAKPGDLPDWWPKCLQCGKHVEAMSVDHGMVDIDISYNGRAPEPHQTGEVIVTVECHGETWKISNLRGPLQPSDVRIKK